MSCLTFHLFDIYISGQLQELHLIEWNNGVNDVIKYIWFDYKFTIAAGELTNIDIVLKQQKHFKSVTSEGRLINNGPRSYKQPGQHSFKEIAQQAARVLSLMLDAHDNLEKKKKKSEMSYISS